MQLLIAKTSRFLWQSIHYPRAQVVSEFVVGWDVRLKCENVTSVLVIDDHPIVLQGCRRLLEDAGVTSVLDAGDVAAGYELFWRHRPDVVIVDLAGASGYILKNTATADLLNAIQTIQKGNSYLSHDLALQVALARTSSRQNPLTELTSRELETLTLLAEGKSYDGIAEELNVSYKTVVDIGSPSSESWMPVICLHWSERQSGCLQQPNSAARTVGISMIADCQNFPCQLPKPPGFFRKNIRLTSSGQVVPEFALLRERPWRCGLTVSSQRCSALCAAVGVMPVWFALSRRGTGAGQAA
jgi:CheY-like chemotaxis protein